MAEIMALPYGLMTAVTYLVVLQDQTVLIDPTAPPKRLPSGLPPVKQILATHGHIDHIAEADGWRSLTSAGLAIHAADSACLTEAKRNLSGWLGRPRTFMPAEKRLAEGDRLLLDAEHELEVWHTPGHTAGSCCLLLRHRGEPQALFSGDTLFAGSVGRTDLGGDARLLTDSLRRLAVWCRSFQPDCPRRLTLYPGHGPSADLRQELAHNPYLQGI